MRALLSRLFLPLAISASLAAFFITRAQGGNTELAVLVATLLTLAITLTLERVMPFNAAWNRSQGDVATDVTSAAVLLGVIDPLLKFIAPIAVVFVYTGFGAASPLPWLSESAPFALQLLVVTLLVELGRYGAHRLHHSNRYLWWLHALHHGSERLYAFNNFRFHPLNYLINFSVSLLPVMLIGASPDVILAYLAISQPILMIQHANIDLKSGWLNYVFSTNEGHRWHHSSDATEANRNFGNAFVVWDILLGTFRYERRNANAPRAIGLFAASASYPRATSYFSQLKSAFSPDCCKA